MREYARSEKKKAKKMTNCTLQKILDKDEKINSSNVECLLILKLFSFKCSLEQ